MFANKISLHFCSKFPRYYPSKLIPPKDWKLDYCMVYERRPEEFNLSFFHRTRITLPTMVYTPYWIMLGHMDYKHIGIACILAYHLYREILHLVEVEYDQVQRLYINKNGVDWIVAVNRNPKDKRYILNTREGLEALEIPDAFTVIKIAYTDIKSTNFLDQPEGGLLDFKKLPFVEFMKLRLEADLLIGTYERRVTMEKDYNMRDHYNEFLNPFFSKRQVVFKQ